MPIEYQPSYQAKLGRLTADLAAERERADYADSIAASFQANADQSEEERDIAEARVAKLREALERAKPWLEIVHNVPAIGKHPDLLYALPAVDAVLAETGA